MTYEKYLAKVGGFGKYQKRLCLYLALSSVPNGYLVLSIIFAGYSPPHRCFISALDEKGRYDNFSVFHRTSTSFAGRQILTGDLPRVLFAVTLTHSASIFYPDRKESDLMDGYIPVNEKGQRSECQMFKRSIGNDSFVSTAPSERMPCTDGWMYDIEQERSTFVTEFDFVCSKASMRPFITFIMMLGVMFGSALSGICADRYGRRPVFLVGTLLMFVFFGLCGVAWSGKILAVTIFFAGCFNLVNYASAFVLASEITDKKRRNVIGAFTIGGFALGYMLIPLLAYFIKNWRYLYVANALTGILFIPYYWLIPESPRWLYANGKRKAFVALMSQIAKVNGTTFDGSNVSIIQDFEQSKGKFKIFVKCKVFMKNKLFRWRLFNMCLTWFSTSVIYYGLSLNTSNLGGNAYFNCFMAAAVEIPAYAATVLTINKLGRKCLLIATVVVASVSCGLVPFTNKLNEEASIATAMIGKFSIAATFFVIYLYSSELFPTEARNTAIGLLSTSARVGATVAPFLNYAGEANYSLPYLVMLILGLLCALGTLFLPETNHKPMPEKLKDMPSYKLKIRCCSRKRETNNVAQQISTSCDDKDKEDSQNMNLL